MRDIGLVTDVPPAHHPDETSKIPYTLGVEMTPKAVLRSAQSA